MTKRNQKRRKADTALIRKNFSVGSRSAETDAAFLADCFVENDAFSEITNPDNSKSILLGRTGTGKTAIVETIKRTRKNCYEFDVAAMAFQYIANNTTIRALEHQGVDLMVFYQLLWKHAICLELIQKRWRVQSAGDQGDFLFQIRQWIKGDPRKEKALRYFEEWQDKFWISADENIKEITTKLEEKISQKLGVSMGGISAGGELVEGSIGEIKLEIEKIGRTIVNDLQVARLNELIDLLGAYGFNRSGDELQFLLIDGLDEHWADDAIRFKLIRALLETIKTFKRISGLRLVVAIRSDVFSRAFSERHGASMQREKIYDYITEIKWSKEQLRELIDLRIGRLFRNQYRRQGVDFRTLFGASWDGDDTFDILRSYTLERPRDVIDFVNACLKVAEGEPHVTATHLRKAEHPYSVSRKDALVDEWSSVFPGLERSLEFLSGRNGTFAIEDISDKDNMQWFAYTLVEDTTAERDPLLPWAKAAQTDGGVGACMELAKQLIACLYRIGAVKVKLAPEEPWRSCAEGEAELPVARFSPRSRVAVHEMLKAALGAGRPQDAY